MSDDEAPLRSDSQHVKAADPIDKLKFIHPNDHPQRIVPLLELPIIKEMDDLKKELNISDDLEELDAILDGTLVDRMTDGLTPEQVRTLERSIEELRTMPMKDMVDYVKLSTFI